MAAFSDSSRVRSAMFLISSTTSLMDSELVLSMVICASSATVLLPMA